MDEEGDREMKGGSYSGDANRKGVVARGKMRRGWKEGSGRHHAGTQKEIERRACRGLNGIEWSGKWD